MEPSISQGYFDKAAEKYDPSLLPLPKSFSWYLPGTRFLEDGEREVVSPYKMALRVHTVSRYCSG
jgi:hypothetical protein